MNYYLTLVLLIFSMISCNKNTTVINENSKQYKVDTNLLGSWYQINCKELIVDTVKIYSDSLIHKVGLSLFPTQSNGDFFAYNGKIGIGRFNIQEYRVVNDTLLLSRINSTLDDPKGYLTYKQLTR